MPAPLDPVDDPGLPTSLLTVVLTTDGVRRRARSGLVTGVVLAALGLAAGLGTTLVPAMRIGGSPVALGLVAVVLLVLGGLVARVAVRLLRAADAPARKRVVLALLPDELLGGGDLRMPWRDVAEVFWTERGAPANGVQPHGWRHQTLRVVPRGPIAAPGREPQEAAPDVRVRVDVATPEQWRLVLTLLPELAARHGFVFHEQDEAVAAPF